MADKGDVLKKHGKYIIAILIFFALVIRLILAETMKGYGETDLQCYQRWAENAAADFANVYRNTDIDYPPVYLYVLFFVGKALLLFNNLPMMQILLLKLPAIIADILTALFIYRIACKRFNSAFAMIISTMYLFNPAVFVNSAMWGQTDSILTLIAVLALYYLLQDKIIPSTVFFTMACLMKPQGFIFLPILLLELIRKKDLKKFLLCVVTGLATGFIIILPFTVGQDIFWIVRLFLSDLSKYPYADMHAFNIFFLMGGDLVTDSTMFLFMPYKAWSLIFTVGVFGLVGFMYLKSKRPLRIFFMTLVLQSCIFMFTGRMHERYLYPVILLLIMVFIQCKDRRLISIYIWMSALIFVNQLMVLYCSNYLDDAQSWLPYFNMTGYVFSVLGLFLVIRLIIVARDILHKADCATGDGSLSQKEVKT